MKKSFMTDMSWETASADSADTVRHLLSMAFGFSRERAREYVENVGVSSFRLVRAATGEAKACAAILPTAHMFGGRDVPAASIAHVAIAPEARGQGLAVPLMQALCDDARQAGALMVSLFASARPVYRKCGFELAGSEIVYEAETSELPVRTKVAFFEMALDDRRIEEAYTVKRAAEAGLVRRSQGHWRELTRAPRDALAAYCAGGNQLDAYAIVDASNAECLEVRDWHAVDGGMAEALLCFLGRFQSVYPKVRWHGGPQDELVSAMPDKGWRLAHQEEWLANIVDPAGALESRGYLPGKAELGIRITDAAGGDIRLRLRVKEGRASVDAGEAGGLPSISISKPGFATLFTGFCSASRLARRGLLSGSAEAVQLCDRVFAGPQPWVAEHF